MIRFRGKQILQACQITNFRASLKHIPYSILIQSQAKKIFASKFPNFFIFNKQYCFSAQPSQISQLQEQAQFAKIQSGEKSIEYLQKLQLLADFYLDTNIYEQAIKSYQMIISTLETDSIHKQSPFHIGSIQKLRLLYKKTQNIPSYIPLTQKLLSTKIKKLGQQNEQVISIVNDLAWTHFSIRNLHQAIELYNFVIPIKQKMFGINSLQAIEAENAVTTVYYELGQGQKAKDILLNNIKKIKNIPNFNENLLTRPLMVLVEIFVSLQQYEEANARFEQFMEIFKKQPQTLDIYVARVHFMMGFGYLNMGETQKGQELIKESQKINIQLLGSDEGMAGQTSHNIGSCYEQNGDYEKAIEYYKKSIKSKEQEFGDDHFALVQTSINLGTIYSRMGMLKEAQNVYERSLNIIKKDNPDEMANWSFTEMYLKIGTLYLQDLQVDKAKGFLDRAIELMTHFHNEKVSFSSKVVEGLSGTFTLKENYAQAIKAIKKAVQCIEAIIKSEKSLTKQGQLTEMSKFYQTIGQAYSILRNSPQAKQYYFKAILIIQTHFQNNYDELIAIYEKLGDLQMLEGNKSYAQDLYSKVDQLFYEWGHKAGTLNVEAVKKAREQFQQKIRYCSF